jgi:hypothetical protein
MQIVKNVAIVIMLANNIFGFSLLPPYYSVLEQDEYTYKLSEKLMQ